MFRVCSVVFALACLCAPAFAGLHAVRSEGSDVQALVVPRGGSRALMSEIWTGRADGSDLRRVGLFLGEPGDLGFLPGGQELVYLEQSILYPAYGVALGVHREFPMVKNRIWKLALDGSGREVEWPLPEDLNPLEMSVSPDGQWLAVADVQGLWAVGGTGQANLLLEGPVSGPLCWSVGSNQVRCLWEGEERIVGLPGTLSGEEPIWIDTQTVVVPEPPESEFVKQMMPLVYQAVNWWMRGHSAMHKEQYRGARQAFREASAKFRDIYKEHGGKGISAASSLRYAEAIKGYFLGESAFNEAVCGEHLLLLGDLMAQYSLVNGMKLPPDLQTLETWAIKKVKAETPDPKTREKHLEMIHRLLHCPEARKPHVPAFEYLCRADSQTTQPILTCYWHPGRVLHLVRRAGGYALKTQDLRPAQVDSMYALAEQLQAEGDTQGAIFPMRVVAHQRQQDKEPYIRLGHIFLKLGNRDGAEWAFRQAVSLSKSDPEPYYGLGLVHMELLNERYQAISYFQRALMRDQNYVNARYQIAYARYILNEHDTKPELERVLEMDPTYADAYVLMGDWYAHFMEDYERAIVWYTKYLSMRPKDESAVRRLGFAYLKVKDYDKILEKLQGFIQEYPNAVELLPIVAQACIKREKYDMAMGFFSSYVSRLDPEEQAYYLDIGLIASAEEKAEYEQTSGTSSKDLLDRFWNGRDPDISTAVNERLLEHYRRVWHARSEFSRGKEPWDRRGDVYIRFGEPDHVSSSRMMNVTNDLAILRVKERLATDLYGADLVGESFAGPVFPVRTFGLQRDVLAFESSPSSISIESERDAASGGGVEDQDADLRQMTLGEGSRDGSASADRGGLRGTGAGRVVGAGGDIGASTGGAVLGGFPTSGIETDPFAYAGFNPGQTSGADLGSIPWETWIYLRIDGGVEITFTDEFNTGAFDFAPVPSAPEVSIEKLTKLWRFSPEKLFAQAVSLSPDFYVPDYNQTPFDFYYTLADFRGKKGYSAIEIYYGIPFPSELYAVEENVTRMAVKRSLALLPASADTVYRRSGDILFQQVGNHTGQGAVLPDMVRMEVPPGVYRLEVKARDRMTGKLGLYRQQVVVEGYDDDRLHLSDLELAWKVVESEKEGQFKKQGLEVIPMASRTYRAGQNVFIYYEIYNLVKDEFGQTKFRVEYTMGPKSGGILAKLVQTLTGKKQKEGVSVGYDQLGVDDSEVAYTELDLGEARSGRHYLTVEVTDLNTGKTVTKETTFVVEK
ncbi:MAG: GWxTD domain-containing protein [bacterium]|nr:GWxTD domain-containing protein [bacterium]